MRQARAQLLILAAATAVVLGGCSTGASSSSPATGQANATAAPAATGSVQPVRVALSFAPNGLLAGLVSTVQRGAFKDAGLDVELVPASSTSDSIKLLAGGATDISLASGLDQLVARSKGVPIVSVAVTLQSTGNGMMTRADSTVRAEADLKQLEGKTVGMTGQTGPKAVFEDILRQNGVDLGKVTFVTVGFNGPAMLAQKSVDALGDAVNYQAPFYNAATGHPLNDSANYHFVSYPDMGAIKFYAASINVSESYLGSNAETVKTFLKVWQAGHEWAIQNPDEAAKLEVAKYPDLKPEIVLAQWKIASDLIRSPDTEAHGIGWQNSEVYSQMSAFLASKGVIAKPVDISTAVKNDYLPAR